MKPYDIAFTILGVLLLVLYVTRVYAQNSLVDESFELSEIEARIQEVKGKNALLEQEILRVTSLQYVEREARKSGFIDATSYYIIR